jgi:predicted outer membrane protein
VAAFTGAEFDRRYADLEVLDHHQDIQEAKDEIHDGSNRQARHDAATELPTLRRHLKLSQAALAAVPG